jgi:hypothetical protein
MAVYKIFPEKDATMYSLFPQMNTGLDEIIEISNLNIAVDSNAQVARYLIQFDSRSIDNLILTKGSGSNWDIDLRCFIATAQGINLDSRLYVYPVSGAWGMGTGKYLDQPIVTNGVSWEWQTVQDGKRWPSLTSSLSPFTTASYSGNNRGGGVWYTGSSLPGLDLVGTQTFSYHSDKDLKVNVTDIAKAWYSASQNLNGAYTKIYNNGFIVKWESSSSYEDPGGNYYIEFNNNLNIQPVLQYYSMDTHTIYPPCLDFKWDDSRWNTGSSTLPVLSTPQAYLSIINNDGFFYSQSVQQFRVDCRPQFPPIIFQTSSIYTNNYYLPSGSSYWAIKDLDTNEYVVNFDPNYTKLSADASGSYFTVYMNGLQPERYYTILIQTTIGQTTQVIDSNYNFKVING